MSTSKKPLHLRAVTVAGGIALLGATGAGMAGSANAATSSSASATLAKIKYCESGGNYQAVNTSSGASGAYQFLTSTWKALSAGKGYATAASAPASVQDAAALELYNEMGTSPWAASSSCWSSMTSTPSSSSSSTSTASASSSQAASSTTATKTASTKTTTSATSTSSTSATSTKHAAPKPRPRGHAPAPTPHGKPAQKPSPALRHHQDPKGQEGRNTRHGAPHGTHAVASAATKPAPHRTQAPAQAQPAPRTAQSAAA